MGYHDGGPGPIGLIEIFLISVPCLTLIACPPLSFAACGLDETFGSVIQISTSIRNYLIAVTKATLRFLASSLCDKIGASWVFLSRNRPKAAVI